MVYDLNLVHSNLLVSVLIKPSECDAKRSLKRHSDIDCRLTVDRYVLKMDLSLRFRETL